MIIYLPILPKSQYDLNASYKQVKAVRGVSIRGFYS